MEILNKAKNYLSNVKGGMKNKERRDKMCSTIRIFKHNKKKYKFSFFKTDGTPYVIPTENICFLTVKKSVAYDDDEIVFQKEFHGNGSNIQVLEFTEFETDIDVGNYQYDIKDVTKQNTLQPPSEFIIDEVVRNG